MKHKHLFALIVVLLLLATVLRSACGDAPLLDERFTVSGEDLYGKDFYAHLKAGDKVSINVSVSGSPVRFAVYNSNVGLLLNRSNVTSLVEDWTAPYADTFDFYFRTFEGTSQVHFTLQKHAGGVDPLLVVIVIVVIVLVLAFVLIVRTRKKAPSIPPPPPPPTASFHRHASTTSSAAAFTSDRSFRV